MKDFKDRKMKQRHLILLSLFLFSPIACVNGSSNYRLAHRLSGGRSTLLEWDEKIPSFPVVHRELLKARKHMEAALVTA